MTELRGIPERERQHQTLGESIESSSYLEVVPTEIKELLDDTKRRHLLRILPKRRSKKNYPTRLVEVPYKKKGSGEKPG